MARAAAEASLRSAPPTAAPALMRTSTAISDGVQKSSEAPSEVDARKAKVSTQQQQQAAKVAIAMDVRYSTWQNFNGVPFPAKISVAPPLMVMR